MLDTLCSLCLLDPNLGQGIRHCAHFTDENSEVEKDQTTQETQLQRREEGQFDSKVSALAC